MQGLEGYIKKGKDPLLFNTFGGLIHSDKLQKTTPAKLETKEAVNQFSVSVFALTAQTKSLDKWEKEIDDIAGKVTVRIPGKQIESPYQLVAIVLEQEPYFC